MNTVEKKTPASIAVRWYVAEHGEHEVSPEMRRVFESHTLGFGELYHVMCTPNMSIPVTRFVLEMVTRALPLVHKEFANRFNSCGGMRIVVCEMRDALVLWRSNLHQREGGGRSGSVRRERNERNSAMDHSTHLLAWSCCTS